MAETSASHLIRPPRGPASDGRSSADNALVDRVRERARAEARRQRLRKIRALLKDLFWLLVLAGLVVGGWRLYRAWEPFQSQTPAPAPAAADASAEAKPQASVSPAAPTGVNPPARREEAFSVAAEIPPEPPKDVRISFYGLLPASERMGAAEGRFELAIPYGETVMRRYAIHSSPTGVVAVVRRAEDGSVKAVPKEEYEEDLKRQGGFVIRSGVAYYVTRSSSPKSWNPPQKPSEHFCASKAYFGMAHTLIRDLGWRTDGLRFEVRLAFGGREDPVPVAVARFGEKTPYSAFRQVAEPIARRLRAHALLKPKARTYRRTVVFYEGMTIGSKRSGVTQIPRRPQAVSGPEYVRWRQLAAEVDRQEREAKRVAAENADRLNAWRRQIKAPPSEEEIRKVLLASSVTIVRKTGD